MGTENWAQRGNFEIVLTFFCLFGYLWFQRLIIERGGPK